LIALFIFFLSLSSAIGRYFKLEGCGHSKERLGTSLMGEIRAGTVTFLTMVFLNCIISKFE